MRKIDESFVNKLIELVDHGLCNGPGNWQEPGQMCVQVAVSKVLGIEYQTDNPSACVHPMLVSLGININDSVNISNKDRAKLLCRFAVAELGSIKIPDYVLGCAIIMALTGKEPGFNKYSSYDLIYNTIWAAFIDMALSRGWDVVVDKLVEGLVLAKTEGSKYLKLLDEPVKVEPYKQILPDPKPPVVQPMLKEGPGKQLIGQ